MRTPLILLLLLAGISTSAQNFFHPDSIHTVEIWFTEPNWDQLLDSMAQAYTGTGTGDGRLIGSVVLDGIAFDSCGVRYKGNSTYDPARDKNPLNIDMNEVIGGQNYLGIDKIKLANEWSDPSFIRDVLMCELGGNYMHIPRANFAKVWINGDYKGLYCNTEHIGNEFLDAHFGSSDGAFFKCDPRTFEIFGDNSNLAYHADTLAYDTLYDMKSDHGLAELQAVTYELEFNRGTIEQFMDVDRILWFHALSNVFAHTDGYMAFAHNYYVYKDHHSRWSPILWDLNLSFGGVPYHGANLWPLTVQELQQLHPYHLADLNTYRPLIAQILQQPRYFKMYAAHYRTIKQETVDNDLYWQIAQHWHGSADTIMAYEPYSGYTYAEFQDNLYNDNGSFFLLRPGIRSLMVERKNYLDTVAWLNLPQPDILSVQVTTPMPASFAPLTFNAQVNNADTVLLGYKQGQFDRFVKVQMYDDGTHDDGLAGDGVYGASIIPLAGDLQYYVYADNVTGARFSPPRAEFEFYEVALNSPLVLNEMQSVNGITQSDQDGEYDDWVELYNNSPDPISLQGHFLSDDPADPNKWAFPDTSIAGNGFLIIWADGDLLQAGLHANFKLSGAGEALLLLAPGGGSLDEVIFPPMNTDQTYGRYPNGTGPWSILVPTFAAHNSPFVGVEEVMDVARPTLYPNPSDGAFNLLFPTKANRNITVYSIHGEFILQQSVAGIRHYLDLRAVANGIYIIRVDGAAIRAVKR